MEKKYVYRVDYIGPFTDSVDLEGRLEKRGKQGWLLCGHSAIGICLKLIFVKEASPAGHKRIAKEKTDS